MTLAPLIWPRRIPRLRSLDDVATVRLFDVAPGVQVLAHCHWQQREPKRCPTLILVHGLEGSSASTYMLGTAWKAIQRGMNVIRVNLRNCGGTMHLTPTLYNAGLSEDIIYILRELKAEGFRDTFIAGYSLGGNIVLKTAGELGAEGPALLSGVVAVSPSIDLDRCVAAMELPVNRFYERWFLRSLRQKILEKARLHPDRYDTELLQKVHSMRTFDDTFTAPAGGYGTAANYYATASAIRVTHKIQVPALIVASHDDPLIPFDVFTGIEQDNHHIELLATRCGGHAAYIHHKSEALPVFDRFWAENRIVDFCQEVALMQQSRI